MYSKEQKDIALRIYHQTESVTETIRILGYPTRRCKRQVLFHIFWQLIFHKKRQLIFHTYLVFDTHGVIRGLFVN